MSNKTDGGPAFPWMHTEGHGGMSLRDYFAAKALHGMLAAFAGETVPFPESAPAARDAYMYADAMLSERDK